MLISASSLHRGCGQKWMMNQRERRKILTSDLGERKPDSLFPRSGGEHCGEVYVLRVKSSSRSRQMWLGTGCGPCVHRAVADANGTPPPPPPGQARKLLSSTHAPYQLLRQQSSPLPCYLSYQRSQQKKSPSMLRSGPVSEVDTASRRSSSDQQAAKAGTGR
ncbi:hypothetical protein Landi51_10579 [Colletotrichum acutatum]